MPGERQGWNDWGRYREAGIVDDTVRFTDNDIETAHAIGKTKETIGMCWPMDAAVAYTLASAGPDAKLSSKQMVNQHTKMAAAMMTQYVGYGTVPDPRVESCGHDEVDAYEVYWREPILNENGHIAFHTTQLAGSMDSIIDKSNPLCQFRVSANIASSMNTVRNAWGILMSPKFAPLRLYIESELGSTKWSAVSSNPFHTSYTNGECKWKTEVYPEGHEKAGHPKKCAHHDKPSYLGWVMIKRIGDDGKLLVNKKTGGDVFERLWSRDRYEASVYEGWNYDQIAQTMGSNVKKTLAPARVVIWDEIKRNLGNQMTDKFVVIQINAACRRMTARNLNCVVKHGERSEEGRILPSTVTYTWKNWTWLAQLKAWIAQTSKKNRKEHDLVNGWKWTKYDSTKSYGFEIAKFKWTPGRVNEKFVPEEDERKDGTYTTPPAITMKIKSYYLSIGGRWRAQHIPYRFKSKADAMQYRNFMSMMAGKCGGVNYAGRKWDGDQGKEMMDDSNAAFIIMSTTHILEMDMNKEPEDNIPSPTEILEKILFGTPQDYDAAAAHLNESTMEKFARPKVIKKEAEVKENAPTQ